MTLAGHQRATSWRPRAQIPRHPPSYCFSGCSYQQSGRHGRSRVCSAALRPRFRPATTYEGPKAPSTADASKRRASDWLYARQASVAGIAAAVSVVVNGPVLPSSYALQNAHTMQPARPQPPLLPAQIMSEASGKKFCHYLKSNTAAASCLVKDLLLWELFVDARSKAFDWDALYEAAVNEVTGGAGADDAIRHLLDKLGQYSPSTCLRSLLLQRSSECPWVMLLSTACTHANSMQHMHLPVSQAPPATRNHTVPIFVTQQTIKIIPEARVGQLECLCTGDHWTRLVPPQDNTRLQMETTGQVVHVGLRLESSSQGLLQVAYVAPGSAADHEGILSGDQVLDINGQPASSLDKGYAHHLVHAVMAVSAAFPNIDACNPEACCAGSCIDSICVSVAWQAIKSCHTTLLRCLSGVDRAAANAFQKRAAGCRGGLVCCECRRLSRMLRQECSLKLRRMTQGSLPQDLQIDLRAQAISSRPVSFTSLPGMLAERTAAADDCAPVQAYPPRPMPLESGSVGYIRIKAFGHSTAAATESAIRKLQAQGASHLVVDLRGNPGGLVQAGVRAYVQVHVHDIWGGQGGHSVHKLDQVAAVAMHRLPAMDSYEIAGLLLDPGEVFCYITNLTGPEHATLLPSDPTLTSSPLVVLVNGGTASTSEVLSAALQAQHRALLLGEHTFGKGRTQRVLPLQDGSTLLVSNALLTSPAHTAIDKASTAASPQALDWTFSLPLLIFKSAGHMSICIVMYCVQVGLEPDVACKPQNDDFQSWNDDSTDPATMIKDRCLQLAIQHVSQATSSGAERLSPAVTTASALPLTAPPLKDDEPTLMQTGAAWRQHVMQLQMQPHA
ncbi:hypothetical protein MMC29_003608 [Sticta canariensis]|nr:hypothetical protein [Sticta canariensis]